MGSPLGIQTQTTSAPTIFKCVSEGTAARFHIHRTWKAIPANSGNYNQIHDMDVIVARVPIEANPNPKEPSYFVAIKKFSGKELSGGETKHLAQIAPEICKMIMIRKYNDQGFEGEWEDISRTNSGWAGMMASKALGLYEVGFMNVAYPPSPLKRGSNWTRSILAGDESSNSYVIKNLTGTHALLHYTVRSIDSRSHTAVIDFATGSRITYESKEQHQGIPNRTVRREKQSGYWKVDLRDGMPLTFHADRVTSNSYDGVVETEATVTDVVRTFKKPHQ